jgi:predicted DNA-binding WGR domain protein
MQIKDQDLAKLLLAYNFKGTTLVCTDNEHYKFYNVNIKDKTTVETTWGRISNRKPQTNEVSCFDSEVEAKKIIKSKLNKGYEYLDGTEVT